MSQITTYVPDIYSEEEIGRMRREVSRGMFASWTPEGRIARWLATYDALVRRIEELQRQKEPARGAGGKFLPKK